MVNSNRILGIGLLIVTLLVFVGCSNEESYDGVKGHIVISNVDIDEDYFNLPPHYDTSSLDKEIEQEEGYVEDELIVTFEDLTFKEILLSNYGGLKVVNMIEPLKAVLFKYSGEVEIEDLLEQVKIEEGVRSVELNGIVRVSTVYPDYPEDSGSFNEQWHYSAISLPHGWSEFDERESNSVAVAVLDTGIDPDHPDLKVSKLQDFTVSNGDGIDRDGHGTHVAGTIGAAGEVLGVNRNVQLRGYKVLGDEGFGYNYNIIKGINRATEDEVDIINMSLGSVIPSMLYEEAINRAYEAGITIIAASGNNGYPHSNYPARYDNVISVGSVNSNLDMSPFSNYGMELDVVAPGESVYSTVLNKWYASWAGTSMAAPHVAGLASLILSRARAEGEDMTPDQIKERLVRTSQDLGAQKLGERGWDFRYGHGLINAHAAVVGAERTKAQVFAGIEKDGEIIVLSDIVNPSREGFYDIPLLEEDAYIYSWIDVTGTGKIEAGDYFGRTEHKVGPGLNVNLTMKLITDKDGFEPLKLAR